MPDSPTLNLKKRLKNKKLFKNLFCQLLVLVGVAVTHALLFSLFTQKHGTHRHHRADSYAARKIMQVKLLVDGEFIPKTADPIEESLTPLIPQAELPPPPDFEPEKTDSLFGQETPQQEPYLPTNKLTEKPVVQVDITPDIGLRLATNTDRSAILRLQLNEQGQIDQVFFEKGDFSEAEIQLLIAACKEMKFTPGKLNKTPVKSEMRIEMIIPSLSLKLPFQ